ncbi:MAG TPA: hypothetical protein ENK57_17085, partial [Polyangiaceae bacterium]|nr:hypothetical protein [Polyangiaceae bacterium]
MWTRSFALLCFALPLAAGCDCGGPAPSECSADSDCGGGGFYCSDGVCYGPMPRDAGLTDAAPRSDGGGGDACALTCGAACCGVGERCVGGIREPVCAADLGPCADDGECLDDSYCHEGRCTPYGTPPRGEANDACRREVQPGRFVPAIQCRWDHTPDGDPAPDSIQVESTPLVVDFGIGRTDGEPIRPSIVFISTATFSYGDGGIVRVIDGRSCMDQGVLSAPEDRVGAATTPAIGDLDGDGRPEIVAKSAAGGLVAFEWTGTEFVRRWFSTRADGARDMTGGS